MMNGVWFTGTWFKTAHLMGPWKKPQGSWQSLLCKSQACLCRSYSTHRFTYALVPSPPSRNVSHSASNPNHPLRFLWRPINSSLLNLGHQFASNNLSSLQLESLSQNNQFTDSNQIGNSVGAKTSPKVIGPPRPPGPEDCCMSGCATCVYDIYAQESEEYLESLKNPNNIHQNESNNTIQKKSIELTEEIDNQEILNNSLKVFAQFEKKQNQ